MTDNGPFFITDAAAQRVLDLQKGKGVPYVLRVQVEGGGCAGFRVQFLLEEASPLEDDVVFEHLGAHIVVDAVSLEHLQGATVDYVDTLMESSFIIRNPGATASCGCGASFSVL